MLDLLNQAFGPDVSVLGRILALIVIAAVLIFFFMARQSMASRREREAEEALADQRAEALVAEVRRERQAN